MCECVRVCVPVQWFVPVLLAGYSRAAVQTDEITSSAVFGVCVRFYEPLIRNGGKDLEAEHVPASLSALQHRTTLSEKGSSLVC